MAYGGPGWRQRVTGRWAISWQVIVIGSSLTYPQMVLTGGTLGGRPVQEGQMPTVATISAAFLAANIAYSFLAMATVFRNREVHPVPLWLYFGFYASAAVLPVASRDYLINGVSGGFH